MRRSFLWKFCIKKWVKLGVERVQGRGDESHGVHRTASYAPLVHTPLSFARTHRSQSLVSFLKSSGSWMMNDLTGMEGRKLGMPSASALRAVGRVTGRQRGWALGINTIPFHFTDTAFPVEMASPQPTNLSAERLREAMTICESLLRGVHQDADKLATSRERGSAEFFLVYYKSVKILRSLTLTNF